MTRNHSKRGKSCLFLGKMILEKCFSIIKAVHIFFKMGWAAKIRSLKVNLKKKSDQNTHIYNNLWLKILMLLDVFGLSKILYVTKNEIAWLRWESTQLIIWSTHPYNIFQKILFCFFLACFGLNMRFLAFIKHLCYIDWNSKIKMKE